MKITAEQLKKMIKEQIEEVKVATAGEQLAESPIPDSDWEDAFWVLKNWPRWKWTRAGLPALIQAFESAKAEATIVPISIAKIKLHKDWGRKPTAKQLKTPIIVLALPHLDSYVVLDGQHRVLELKRQGVSKIQACVLNLPYRLGMSLRGVRDIVFNP